MSVLHLLCYNISKHFQDEQGSFDVVVVLDSEGEVKSKHDCNAKVRFFLVPISSFVVNDKHPGGILLDFVHGMEGRNDDEPRGRKQGHVRSFQARNALRLSPASWSG
jgi:hypothetical protein